VTTEASGLTIAYRPTPTQAAVHACEKRFRCVVAGRQSGKTLLAVVEIAQYALSHPRSNLYWVTASYRTKDRAWRGLLEVIPRSPIRRKHETELFIELRNGSRIAIRSADAKDSLVSETLHGVVCDEFAQWDEDVWTMNLRPMLATTNGWALFIGTPRGLNWAHALYLRGLGDDPDWASFHWPSSASPYFGADEVERARREMPERIFRQEVEASFEQSGGAVFRNVESCFGPLVAADGYTVMGVDLARTQDYTAIHLLNSRRETVQASRWQRVDWATTKARIIDSYRKHQCVRAVVDATGVGDPIVEDLIRAGLAVAPLKFTNESKSNLIERLMLLFEQTAIRIPRDYLPLYEELNAFTFETLPSGRDRFSAPDGRHDDTVIALALAAHGLAAVRYGDVFAREPQGAGEREIERLMRVREAEANGTGWFW
jgi:hypothetical protein